MTDKPDAQRLDPALAAAIDQVRRELKADLGEALKRGAAAWASQSNQVFESHAARLARLERTASQAAARPDSSRTKR